MRDSCRKNYNGECFQNDDDITNCFKSMTIPKKSILAENTFLRYKVNVIWYYCNIHSLNPFINFKLEGHKYEPTQ